MVANIWWVLINRVCYIPRLFVTLEQVSKCWLLFVMFECPTPRSGACNPGGSSVTFTNALGSRHCIQLLLFWASIILIVLKCPHQSIPLKYWTPIAGWNLTGSGLCYETLASWSGGRGPNDAASRFSGTQLLEFLYQLMVMGAKSLAVYQLNLNTVTHIVYSWANLQYIAQVYKIKGAWIRTNLHLFSVLMHLLGYRHLKRPSVFINRSFNVVVSLMHLWVLALLTCMEDALRVFKKMPSHDVVSWTALLLGHAKCRQGQKALQLFQQMKREGNQTLSLLWGSWMLVPV